MWKLGWFSEFRSQIRMLLEMFTITFNSVSLYIQDSITYNKSYTYLPVEEAHPVGVLIVAGEPLVVPGALVIGVLNTGIVGQLPERKFRKTLQTNHY